MMSEEGLAKYIESPTIDQSEEGLAKSHSSIGKF